MGNIDSPSTFTEIVVIVDSSELAVAIQGRFLVLDL
jgi:hypothetical protein